LAAYRNKRLRRATLINLAGTFFIITLTRIVIVRWVLLGRVLLARDLSALVRRILLGLIHRSSGVWLLAEVPFDFVSHEFLLYRLLIAAHAADLCDVRNL
jgi:hypothetical protein